MPVSTALQVSFHRGSSFRILASWVSQKCSSPIWKAYASLLTKVDDASKNILGLSSAVSCSGEYKPALYKEEILYIFLNHKETVR